MKKCSFLGFLLVGLSGCTVIHYQGGKTETRLGILKLEPDDSSQMTIVQSTGLGLVPGVRGFTIGYSKEYAVVAGKNSSCKVIVFGNELDDTSRSFWHDMSKNNQNVCVLFDKTGEEK